MCHSHRRNPGDPGRALTPGLDSRRGTRAGMNRGGVPGSVAAGDFCSLGVSALLTSVLRVRTLGHPGGPGAHGSSCRSLALSLPSFYQFPDTQVPQPPWQAGEDLSHLFILARHAPTGVGLPPWGWARDM